MLCEAFKPWKIQFRDFSNSSLDHYLAIYSFIIYGILVFLFNYFIFVYLMATKLILDFLKFSTQRDFKTIIRIYIILYKVYKNY